MLMTDFWNTDFKICTLLTCKINNFFIAGIRIIERTFEIEKDWKLCKSLPFPALLNSDSSNEFEGIDRRGMTHFVENHFVKNYKIEQKISGWSLRRKVPLAFWHVTYGVS